MSANERFSFGSGGWSSKFLLSEAGKLSMVVLLFAGIIHATPVAGFDGRQLQGSEPPVLHNATLSASQLAESTLETSAPRLRTWTFGEPAAAGCVFSGSCSSEVEVPESQSLLLVGTGLLSMAGIIRRRLMRQG